MSIQEKNRDDVRLLKSAREVWTDVLEILEKRLTFAAFQTLIRPMHLLEISDTEAVCATYNEFNRSIVMRDHVEAMAAAFAQVVKSEIAVRIVVDGSLRQDVYIPTLASISVASEKCEGGPGQRGISTDAPRSPGHSEPPRQQAYADSSRPAGGIANNPVRANLNEKYTFETFVVGSHNRFCHSAALSVAGRPGQNYNPLFIYGGVGLGKTHIMQAIGHEILRHSPHLAVRYITCERFTNELINSIRDDKMIDFRKRYRQVDVLLIDDIQFLAGKESTQEEFFYTFNTLRDQGSHIVLSSDRPPKSIATLEERLRSRFEWGLITDMQAPDFETRLAILQKKCAVDNLSVPPDVLEQIATLFTNNIRELEGALIRATAYANLTGSPLTVASVSGVLQPGGAPKARPPLTIEKIIDTVAEAYRVEPSEIRSSKRSQDLALPRHIAMYIAHEVMQMSFPRIGQSFGNRKHTSAIYAHSRIKELLASNVELSASIKRIRDQLGN